MIDNNERTGIVIIYLDNSEEHNIAKSGFCPVCKTVRLTSTLNSVSGYCQMCDKLICVDTEYKPKKGDKNDK